ncbi:hypothetical protein E2C01_066691 [Portunus trituberculatus]|uniref:Uncharacterized protein n=1 Tax=Portunus trituberculatus TaxID=210409 RepID=A0A5B7HT10_PORTR|nr:hypothetical protein [Portunus trituberculatus]
MENGDIWKGERKEKGMKEGREGGKCWGKCVGEERRRWVVWPRFAVCAEFRGARGTRPTYTLTYTRIHPHVHMGGRPYAHVQESEMLSCCVIIQPLSPKLPPYHPYLNQHLQYYCYHHHHAAKAQRLQLSQVSPVGGELAKNNKNSN